MIMRNNRTWEVDFLADSNITKRALSMALKELMESRPFSKISIGDICEKCEMNRKSFYYHFRDKYDLVNWIYDTEFFAIAQKKDYADSWELLEDLCGYFYENRSFYRKTFSVDGQNSFSDYFRAFIAGVLKESMAGIFGGEDSIDFFVDFYADALVCAVKRWLLSKDCIPASEFVLLMKKCLMIRGISS